MVIRAIGLKRKWVLSALALIKEQGPRNTPWVELPQGIYDASSNRSTGKPLQLWGTSARSSCLLWICKGTWWCVALAGGCSLGSCLWKYVQESPTSLHSDTRNDFNLSSSLDGVLALWAACTQTDLKFGLSFFESAMWASHVAIAAGQCPFN